MGAREGKAPARHSAIAMAFIAGAVVLGGGGSPNPVTEILLQLLFVAAALAWLWIPARGGPMPVTREPAAWLICGLVLALPLAQLIPLPPGVWTALPGQEDRIAALALVGDDTGWQPLTHSPARTFAALLALFPALFAFLATASLDARGRFWVVSAVAAMALVTALLGALQLSFGAEAPYLYAENHRGVVTGFQANRNAAVDLLLIGMAAAVAMLAPSLAAEPNRQRLATPPWRIGDRRIAALTLAGLLVVLFFAAVLTASRAGIALLPLVLLGAWAILRPALSDLGGLRYLPGLVVLVAVVVVIVVAMQGGNAALGSVAERFVFSDDYRRELWRDGWYMANRAWPAGIGLGGAQSALIAAERLEVLDSMIPNRVHNDYLELALEGGVLGLALLGAVCVVLAWLAWRAWLDRPRERHFTALGLIILLVAALHSFVDYPLRSMALACLIGTGAGLLMAPRRNSVMDAAATDESRA